MPRGDRLPAGLITIAYDSLGNLICISLRQHDFGFVYFWDHQTHSKQKDTEPTIIAESFEKFLACLQSELASSSIGQENQAENQSEIDRIIAEKDINALKDLLKSGYDLEAMDDDYLTLLDRVTIAGDLTMVKLVVSRGAKIDDALEIARDNAQFNYPGADHHGIVRYLESLKKTRS